MPELTDEDYRTAIISFLQKGDQESASEVARRWDAFKKSGGVKAVEEPDTDRSATPRKEQPELLSEKIYYPVSRAAAGAIEKAWRGDAEFDLPHIATQPEFQEESTLWQDVRNVFSSPESVADAFIKRKNKTANREIFRKGTDEAGNILIERRNAQKKFEPYAYADTPGMDWRDVRDTAAQIAPYALTGGLVGTALRATPWLARAAGLSGAELATLEWAGQVRRDDITNLERGVAAVSGPVGEMLGPVMRAITGNKPLTARQVRMGMERAKAAGAVEPTETTARLFAMKELGMLPEDYQDDALLALGQRGLPSTRGEMMTGGNFQQRVARERQIGRESGLTDTDELAMLPQERELGLGRLADDELQASGAVRPEPEMGEEIIDVIHGASRELKDEASKLYDTREWVGAYGFGIPVAGTARQYHPVEVLSTQIDNIIEREAAGQGKVAKATLDLTRRTVKDVKRLLRAGEESGTWSLKDIDDTYRIINRAQVNAKGEDAKIIGKVKETYREWVQDQIYPRIDADEKEVMDKLFRASDLWGQYTRKFGSSHNAIDAAIADVASGRGDPELIGTMLFRGDKFGGQGITARQVKQLLDVLPENQQARMMGLMREGTVRRIFSDVDTGSHRQYASDMLDNIETLFSGSRSHLGNFLFPPGSRMREELREVSNILRYIKSIDEHALAGEATMKKLSALYARINTPIGIRMVTAIPNIPAKIWRNMLGRKAARPVDRGYMRLSPQEAGMAGATAGAITSPGEQP